MSHNVVIDAGHNNLLFATGTDMDREHLRLSHMQKGTYYVQICDNSFYTKKYRFVKGIFNLKEEVEDTKGVIGIHKSKDRQHNGQKKKDKTYT